jgi:hypothetical protein
VFRKDFVVFRIASALFNCKVARYGSQIDSSCGTKPLFDTLAGLSNRDRPREMILGSSAPTTKPLESTLKSMLRGVNVAGSPGFEPRQNLLPLFGGQEATAVRPGLVGGVPDPSGRG